MTNTIATKCPSQDSNQAAQVQRPSPHLPHFGGRKMRRILRATSGSDGLERDADPGVGGVPAISAPLGSGGTTSVSTFGLTRGSPCGCSASEFPLFMGAAVLWFRAHPQDRIFTLHISSAKALPPNKVTC